MKSHFATAACAAVALIAHAGSASAQQADTAARTAPAAQRAPGAYMNIGFSGLVSAGWSSLRDPRPLQLGDHDPRVRGFSLPGSEITLDGAVDPFFKGFVAINYKLDEAGETGVEFEEGYVLTTSLPKNLQLKAGQFLTDFGRQNTQHPHAWSFVDVPLVLGTMFGADGLRGAGARLSWLLPTSFYTEAMLTVMNANGETAYSFGSEESADIHGGIPAVVPPGSPKDLLYVPRLSASVDLSDTQTLLAGVSAALGPNSGSASFDSRTKLYGADLYWKWKSLTAGQGFPFVSLQAEAIMRDYEAGVRVDADDLTAFLPAESISDAGGYAQVLWGIKPRVVLGLRGESISGNPASVNPDLHVDRVRISPSYTWYPSEFSKIRLQYNFDDRKSLGRDHSLWLQFEFIMGAHAAHRF